MSIDFTGVTGIEDDYGNLTKITDASGRVLWSADDGMRTVTLSGIIMNDFSKSWAYFEVDGEKYYRDVSTGSTVPAQVYTFPIGTQIKFVAKAISSLSTTTAKITLNGGTVTEKTATKGGGEVVAIYDYVLNGNVNVMFVATAIQSGTIQNATTTINVTEE